MRRSSRRSERPESPETHDNRYHKRVPRGDVAGNTKPRRWENHQQGNELWNGTDRLPAIVGERLVRVGSAQPSPAWCRFSLWQRRRSAGLLRHACRFLLEVTGTRMGTNEQRPGEELGPAPVIGRAAGQSDSGNISGRSSGRKAGSPAQHVRWRILLAANGHANWLARHEGWCRT